MATTATSRSPGCFRGYSNEQKTLRAKLAQLLKWTRDLKTNIMKQSCKALQHNNHHTDENRRQTLDQIHDELDEYKRKLDRELGRIHDICDALTNNPQSKNDADENLDDEILAALRRSPTYSSLEQHIYDDRRPRIRVKPRERIHPGRSQIPRSPFLSTDTIKRKATQPIALQLLDTSCTSGTSKRRAPVDAFKRSRSFTNVEHQETTLGIDYIEEDESDLAWKPFEPKRSISQTTLPSFEPNTDEASTVSSITETPAVPKEKSQAPPPSINDGSSDDEFDVAWERRAKQKARKEAAAPPPPAAPVPPQPIVESPSKRCVRFAPSSDEPTEVVDLDFDDPTPIATQHTTDQNNNHKQRDDPIISLISIDEDETPVSTIEKKSNASQSQITTSSSQERSNRDDDAQVIEDSDDDDVIALSDDETSNKPLNRARKKVVWTSSEIQISSGNSQSQSMHNPYRVGIADPSLRSIFLPPPPPANSQTTSGSSSGNRRSQGGSQRKTSPNKRTTNGK